MKILFRYLYIITMGFLLLLLASLIDLAIYMNTRELKLLSVLSFIFGICYITLIFQTNNLVFDIFEEMSLETNNTSKENKK